MLFVRCVLVFVGVRCCLMAVCRCLLCVDARCCLLLYGVVCCWMWLVVGCCRCARWFAGARCCLRLLVMRFRCLLMFWLLFVVACLLFGVGWCCVLLC